MTSKFATCMMDRSEVLSDASPVTQKMYMLWVLLIKALTLRCLLRLWSPGHERSWEESSDLGKMPKKQFNIFWRQTKNIRNKRSEWSKQNRSIHSSETSTHRIHEGSRWLQVWFPDSIGFGQVQGPMLQRVDEVKASLTQCESEFLYSYFLHRKARLWLSSAKSIFFLRRWIGFTCLKQNSRIFSCVDFHCQSTLVPHCVFLPFLCLQELLLPVSPTRVVQAHHCRAICSERFERQSASFFCATRKHLLVLMIVVLAVWCIQDFSTWRENVWQQPS